MNEAENKTPKVSYRAKEGRYTIWTKTPEGKRHKPAYGRTPEECLASKERIEQTLRDAQAVPQSTTPSYKAGTVAHFVHDPYWPHIISTAKPRTRSKYGTQITRHVLPARMPDGRTFGELLIGEVGYLEVNALSAGIRRFKRVPKSKPAEYQRTDELLSNSEKREILLRVHEILTFHNRLAQGRGERTREDWKLVAMPRKPRKKKRLPLPADFATRLLAEAAKCGRPWMVGPLFCAQYLAMREGEACGFRKADIDRENLEITLNWQRQYLGKNYGGFQDTDLKSATSHRTIGVPQELIDYLDRLSDPSNLTYMFTNNAGGPCSPRAVCEMTPKLCKAAGLPRVTFHDLRSYAASNLMALGFDLLTISSILGHASIDVTLLYLNTTPNAQRAALAGLMRALQPVDKAIDGTVRASA